MGVTGNVLDSSSAGGVDTDTQGEGHIVILPINYNSITQGTWVLGISSLRYNCGTYNNTTTAQNDDMKFKVYLAAGTYTLRMMANKASDKGMSAIKVDGVQVADFDWYAAGASNNDVQEQVGIVIATSGLKDLQLIVDDKNGASSDYHLNWNNIGLWRTA